MQEGTAMNLKPNRRAALKLLTATPLGLALSTVVVRETVAQAPSGTFGSRTPSESVRGVAAQGSTDADVINDWNATAVAVIVTDAATAPPEAFQYLGFVHSAIYNAVNGITRRYALYKSNATPGPMASPQVAAAAAAHRVLMSYYGHVPAAVTRLTDAYAASIGAGPYDPATTQGIQYGRQAAERIIALRADDGRYGPNVFEKAPAPGVWRPTPPANAPMFGKFLCDCTPQMIESPSQFRPGPPPDMASAEYARDFEEVKALGSKEGSARTPLQTETGLFVSSIVPGPLHAALRDLTVRREMDISDRARLFAAVSMSVADAAIAVWDSKVHYGFWRPSTAIQLADEDGNSATVADRTWEPLLVNPAYPDYTSGLNGVIGSATRALTRVLGTERMDLTISSPMTNTTRTYEFADQLCADAVDGRVWVGLHFRFADAVAMAQGQQVADWALDRYFQPV
jgi:hypothetical protein